MLQDLSGGDFKYLFPSFHLPKGKLKEVPHQSITSSSTISKVGRNRCGIQTLKSNMLPVPATSSITSYLTIALFKTLHGRFEDCCDEQWAADGQALEESDRLTWSQVQGVKAKLHQKFVLYNE